MVIFVEAQYRQAGEVDVKINNNDTNRAGILLPPLLLLLLLIMIKKNYLYCHSGIDMFTISYSHARTVIR